jgi:hypothetical protein
MFETIRAHGAVRMGLIKHIDEAAQRQHTPKVAFVARRARLHRVQRQAVGAGDIDLLVRALSMGKLHHAMMGTAAVAIGTAAAIPGTLVNLAAGGGERAPPCASAIRRAPARRRRSGAAWRGLERHQGRHEPQRARADGRLGARAGAPPACRCAGCRSAARWYC